MNRGILLPNSQGLVTTTAVATGDLVHTLSTPSLSGCSAKIVKIMYSNNTGANGTLIFGTQNNAAVPAFVALFPTITCINGFDDYVSERFIPDVIFRADGSAAPAGRSGDIYVVSSVAGILVRITVEELR